MNCGKEPGGSKAGAEGVCPASTADWLDGVNQGRNGGRACWVVAGSLCDRHFPCVFSKDFQTCGECVFLRTVVSEEYPDLQINLVSPAMVNRETPFD